MGEGGRKCGRECESVGGREGGGSVRVREGV